MRFQWCDCEIGNVVKPVGSGGVLGEPHFYLAPDIGGDGDKGVEVGFVFVHDGSDFNSNYLNG